MARPSDSFQTPEKRRPSPPILTDRRIRTLVVAPTPVDVRDGARRGLILTVLPSGRKQFSLRYRFGGKQRRYVLGDWPDLTLASARKRARKVQTEIDDGRNPVAERQAKKAERTDTLGALARDYLAKHAKKFKRAASAAEDERMLERDVLPRWRDRSVRELTRRDVRQLVERVAERAPVIANRVLAVVRKMLNFAVDQEWIDANPASRVKKPTPEVSRDRVLGDDELRRVWRLLSHFPTTAERPAPKRRRAKGEPDDPICPVSPAIAALLKVQLLTAQRSGEVARMRWRDLDLDAGWWTISGSDTKNGEPHRVYLAKKVRGLIRQQQKPDDNTQEKAETQEREYVFAGRGRSVRDRAKKAPATIARLLGIEFRGHDLRRTAATKMAEAGIPREHISAVLNHVEGGARATRVYDRYSRDHEKQIALETWARKLDVIVTGKPAAAVVPFTPR